MTGAWQREHWTNAQVNARCTELERDLKSIMRDKTLTIFQRSVLSHMAVEAAAQDLVQYDRFRGVSA